MWNQLIVLQTLYWVPAKNIEVSGNLCAQANFNPNGYRFYGSYMQISVLIPHNMTIRYLERIAHCPITN